MGYIELWKDMTARRYELSGLSIKSVRTSKIGMRKALGSPNPFSSVWNQIQTSLSVRA